MKYSLQYQYKGPDDERPEDYGQQNELALKEGEPLVVPNVGDSVTLMLTRPNKLDAYKVVSRLFSYDSGWCHINIVVTDLDDGEYLSLIKE
jgi:hypothetical protein